MEEIPAPISKPWKPSVRRVNCTAMKRFLAGLLGLALARSALAATLPCVADLNLGETQEVGLANGAKAHIKLVALDEKRDPLRDAIREARVQVEINGTTTTLSSANYNLPVSVGGVQVDCPVTRGYNANSTEDKWGLHKDARLRLWPAGSPWLEPGTFGYPLKQRWFASGTQMANEPCHVDGSDVPAVKKIYYHDGLDFGGCEGLVEVVVATTGLVVSAAAVTLPGYENTPVHPRADVIYVLDGRGWYYRYSHLCEIDRAIKPGTAVTLGQRLGLLGKEGASGGWSHLHFDIKCRQPSGLWGTQEAYAFAWEAYVRQHAPKLIAVARPHVLARVGDVVTLDGSKSWSALDKVSRYDWTFCDGTAATGATVKRSYAKPGTYSEILKVTDDAGAVAYDFAVVQIIDPAKPDQLPPTIQAAYAPSLDLMAGAPVTFKVRTFRTTEGAETWNFGDGSALVTVKSDGCVKLLAKDGFAITEHRFGKPGVYLISVERANKRGEKAIARLVVEVGP